MSNPPPLPTPQPLFETILHRDDHEKNLVNSILPHNTINRLTLGTNQREFLLTISIQYQTDKWQEERKISIIEDYQLIQYQILRTNITRMVWQTVRRITYEILGMERLKETVLTL